MCVIKRFTDIYPREIRTRQTIYRCLFSDGIGTCHNTRVYDHGEVYHVRRPRSEDKQGSSGPIYRIVEPVEQTRPETTRKSSHSSKWRQKDKGFVFEFRIPFTRRTSKAGRGLRALNRQDRETDLHRFTANPPEEPAVLRRPARRSSYQEVRPRSPRISIFPRRRPQQPPIAALPPETPRRQEAPLPSRPPRKRTPVSHRVPLRRLERTSLSSPVEVHSSHYEDSPPLTPIREHFRQRNRPKSKRVRFAADVDYEKRSRDGAESNGSCEGQRNRHTEEGPHCNNQFAEGAVREPEDARQRRHRFRRFMERNLWPRSSGPQPGRLGRTQRMPMDSTVHRQPRVVQDGNRRISETGNRVIAEARARHNRERFVRDF